MDAVVSSGIRCVTTIENEYPFLSYIEQAGGPAGLSRRGEMAVYTAGFPTPRLVAALTDLARRSGAAFSTGAMPMSAVCAFGTFYDHDSVAH